MTNEFQIVYHNIDQTEAISEAVQKRIDKLERYCDHIINGRVVLDSPHNNHHKGKVYSVTLEIHTPELEVRVNQDQHDNRDHQEIEAMVPDADPAVKEMADEEEVMDDINREAAA